MKLFFVSTLTTLVIAIPSAHASCRKSQASGFSHGETISIWTPVRKHIEITNRTVLILPSTANKTFLDEIQARALCRRKIRAMVLDSWNLDKRNVGDPKLLDTLMSDARIFADELLSRYPGKFGIFGTSLGAGIAAYIRGVDHRFGASIFLVGGADVPQMLSKTQSPVFKPIRQAQMAALGVNTTQAYESDLRKILTLDPAQVADPKAKNQIRMVGADLDNAVPTPTQDLLWEAWGRPKRIVFNFNHIPTILISQLLLAPCHARFFKNHL